MSGPLVVSERYSIELAKKFRSKLAYAWITVTKFSNFNNFSFYNYFV